MDRKSKLRIIGINLFLFAILFGLISFNKEFLRPLLDTIPSARILIWSFPNFIAAYVIGLFFVNGVAARKPKNSRFIVYIGSFLVFALLTFEELKPIWGVSTHYDSFDIIASGIGSLLSILTFELIFLKLKKKK